jgi:iron complex transport system substrate-binding protein
MGKLHLCLILVCLLNSCTVGNIEKRGYRMVEDALGRKVQVPDPINRIIALRAGALRLILYMDCSEKVVALEANERRREVPYMMAHPELAGLNEVGRGNSFDAELILMNQPDIIFLTYAHKEMADELEAKTGIPVFALNYGDLSTGLQDFYNTLSLLGSLLNREERADSLISYTKSCILDLHRRSTADSMQKKAELYIGGVAYSGSHGLCSTVPHYPPFHFLNAGNVASAINPDDIQGTYIDIEQLILWDPEMIFIDASGEKIIHSEIARAKIPTEHLKAFRGKSIYRTWPYNWYTINYENILINAYHIGKTIYPEAFRDIDPQRKADEIYAFFLGKTVNEDMIRKFGKQGACLQE